MFKFIIKTVSFLILFIIIISLSIIIPNYIYNNKSNKKAIYIWGDSQTYRGIDLIELHRLTNSKIYSAAKHGGSVYDFYVFTTKVPSNTQVIISISTLSQTRPKYLDRNRAGISLISLRKLLEYNYSKKELYQLLSNNLRVFKLFSSQFPLYPNLDSVLYNYPISRFIRIFSTIPNYLSDKQAIFFDGINHLSEKNCKIFFIEFPLYPKIENILKNSPISVPVNSFKNKIINSFKLKQKTRGPLYLIAHEKFSEIKNNVKKL